MSQSQILDEYPVSGSPDAVSPPHGVLEAPEVYPRKKTFQLYFFAFFLLPCLAFCAAFPLVRAPWFERIDPSKWGPVLDFSFTTPPRNADILIFGDSSAFLGIDPHLLEAQLGLKTLVLPNTIGSLPVVNDEPLRRYLASHRPPRLLVLYFTAWDLDYARVSNRNPFEGEEMLIRYGSRRSIAVFAAKHPGELLLFPFRLYSTFGPAMIHSLLHPVDHALTMANALGHVDDRENYPRLGPGCVLPATLLAPTGMASVQKLVSRYTTPRTAVMVYIAPVPACGNAGGLLKRTFASAGAAPPYSLPPASFVSDSYFAHMKPDAVPQASQLLANTLRSKIGKLPLSP